jgi:hypothetical protein
MIYFGIIATLHLHEDNRYQNSPREFVILAQDSFQLLFEVNRGEILCDDKRQISIELNLCTESIETIYLSEI